MNVAVEPIGAAERIAMLDITRGVAVLGILLMNITGMGLPDAYDDPTNWGGAEGANLLVWRIMALLFEGTMRGLFTLLFGAGALLFLERLAARSADLRPADLYFRRTLWLIVFGLLNAYVLLWDGDILFYYGVTGLVLFVFRTLPPRRLIACAALALALQTGVTTIEWMGYREAQHAALAARSAPLPLSEAQHDAVETLRAIEEDFKPTLESKSAEIASMQASYASAHAATRGQAWHAQTDFFFRHGLLDALGMMLLGMALLKLGVLSGAAPTRRYVMMVLVGYTLGLAINSVETARLESAGFSVQALIESYLTYDLGRVPMTLGHLGLIALFCRTMGFDALKRTLAVVGQMALTNYLAQSALALFIFTGAGLALYGRLERYELYYVVLLVWALQLLLSAWWMRRFRFGPAEWLWRSLTYWRVQPLRRGAPAAAVAEAPSG